MSMYELVKSIKADVSDLVSDSLENDSRVNVSPTGNFFYMQVGGENESMDGLTGDVVAGLIDIGNNVLLDGVKVPLFTGNSYIITDGSFDHEGTDGATSMYLYVLTGSQTNGYTVNTLPLSTAQNTINDVYCVFKAIIAQTNNSANNTNLSDIYLQLTNPEDDHSEQIGSMVAGTGVMKLAGIPLPPEGKILLNSLVCGNYTSDGLSVDVWLIIFQEYSGDMIQLLKYKLFHYFMNGATDSVSIDLSNTPPIVSESLLPANLFKYLVIVTMNSDAESGGHGYAYLNATIQINSNPN